MVTLRSSGVCSFFGLDLSVMVTDWGYLRLFVSPVSSMLVKLLAVWVTIDLRRSESLVALRSLRQVNFSYSWISLMEDCRLAHAGMLVLETAGQRLISSWNR